MKHRKTRLTYADKVLQGKKLRKSQLFFQGDKPQKGSSRRAVSTASAE